MKWLINRRRRLEQLEQENKILRDWVSRMHDGIISLKERFEQHESQELATKAREGRNVRFHPNSFVTRLVQRDAGKWRYERVKLLSESEFGWYVISADDAKPEFCYHHDLFPEKVAASESQ